MYHVFSAEANSLKKAVGDSHNQIKSHIKKKYMLCALTECMGVKSYTVHAFEDSGLSKTYNVFKDFSLQVLVSSVISGL